MRAVRTGAVASPAGHHRRDEDANVRVPNHQGQGGHRRKSPPVPGTATHRPKTLEVSLFPPIDQWGHLAVQIRPLTPRSVSRLARQAETGLAAHQILHIQEFAAVLDSPAQTQETTVPPVPVPRPG